VHFLACEKCAEGSLYPGQREDRQCRPSSILTGPSVRFHGINHGQPVGAFKRKRLKTSQ